MIVKCPECGFNIEFDELQYEPHTILHYGCPRCGAPFEVEVPDRIENHQSEQEHSKESKTEIQSNVISQTSNMAQVTPVNNVQDSSNSESRRGSWKLPAILISVAVLIAVIFSVFVFLLPYIKDKNAPRTYTIANRTNMRSSKDAGGDYNKVNTLPFGSELITYEQDADWSKVKDSDGHEGYISSSYLSNKADFLLLNSIFGDNESRENIATVKCRKALLAYFKQNQLYGKLSSENLAIINPQATLNTNNQWQIFSRAKGLKPNSVFFARLTNPNSKFTDFAVIIKNISTNERRILLFRFDDDETPHFVCEQQAPESGYIIDVALVGSDLYVNYSI